MEPGAAGREREGTSLILQATRELAREVDEIGWHPFYQTDPERLKDYTADVRALQAWLQAAGFRGHCMATEWNYSALYPPLSDAEAARAWCGGFRATEMEKAKYVAQVFTRHTALGTRIVLLRDVLPAVRRARPEPPAAIVRRRSHFAAPAAGGLLRHAEPGHDARRAGAGRVRVLDRSPRRRGSKRSR